MATTVDELVVEIRAETRGVRRGLNDVNKALAKTEKRVKSTGLGFARLAKIGGAIGAAKVGAGVIETSRAFEDLGATLTAITGSQEAAAAGFDLIRKFTMGTTFQLENVSEAFTTLLNAGVVPTSDVLQDFGNVAAAFNKDITQIARAAFNATTGEMEMLKQFGIIARVEGDKLAVTFKGVRTKIDRDADSIIEYIRKIGSEEFPTALEERANTVSGAFSNFKDATAELGNAIGEGGLNDVLVTVTKAFIELIKDMKPVGVIIGRMIKLWSDLITKVFDKLIPILVFIQEAFVGLGTIIKDYLLGQINGFMRALHGTRMLFLETKLAVHEFVHAIVKDLIPKFQSWIDLYNKLAERIAFLDPILSNPLQGFNDELETTIATLRATIEDLRDFKVPILTGFIPPEVKQTITDFFTVIEEGAGSLEEADEAFKKLVKTTAKSAPVLKSKVKTVEDAFKSMEDAIVSSVNAFTVDFANSLLEAGVQLESFKNLAKDIVSQIIATFIQLAIVNRILNSIFSLGLPTFGGATAPATGTGSTGQGTYGVPAAPMTPIPTAHGGAVHPSNRFLVGERGPELFVPHTPGKIVPSSLTPGAIGGKPTIVVNQSLNFALGVQSTVRAEVTNMLPQIVDASKAGVAETIRRGGNLGAALSG